MSIILLLVLLCLPVISLNIFKIFNSKLKKCFCLFLLHFLNLNFQLSNCSSAVIIFLFILSIENFISNTILFNNFVFISNIYLYIIILYCSIIINLFLNALFYNIAINYMLSKYIYFKRLYVKLLSISFKNSASSGIR